MSERLQFIIFMAFGAFCFGSGVLTAFIVTRNKWRDEMIKRGVARYNSRTGKWEWGNRRTNQGRGKCSEAQRIAVNIAKLPELSYCANLSQGRGCAAL
jgi:hypothetical protein